jgi:hypothetical protein
MERIAYLSDPLHGLLSITGEKPKNVFRPITRRRLYARSTAQLAIQIPDFQLWPIKTVRLITSFGPAPQSFASEKYRQLVARPCICGRNAVVNIARHSSESRQPHGLL